MLANLLILGLICAYLMDATSALKFDEKLSTDAKLELIGLGLLKLTITLVGLTTLLVTAIIKLIKAQYRQNRN